MLAALLLCSMALSGCSLGTFSVDTLVAAPKLSAEQQEIHRSLTETVGTDITLKYPKGGDNRSAYVVANIDDEPSDEAIVFFEYNNLSNAKDGINVCVLDKNDDGEWKVEYRFSGPGTDIDKIIITKLGQNENTSIIVGYSTLSMNDKTLEIYNYEGSTLKLIATETYNAIETMDLNNDNYNELITVQAGADGANATASLLSIKDSQLVKSSTTDIGCNADAIINCVKGKVSPTHKALMLDCRNPDGTVHTEFIYHRYSSLQNPVAQIGQNLMSYTNRPDGYYCADVDSDGVIEVPTLEVLKGYELLPSNEQLYLTTWNSYADFYSFNKKLSGFYSISMGYMVSFPESWENKVTVKYDSVTSEYVFYEFSTTLEDSNTELMRVAVCTKSESEQYFDSGYALITSVGQIDYLVKIAPDSTSKLVQNISTIRRNFYVVS